MQVLGGECRNCEVRALALGGRQLLWASARSAIFCRTCLFGFGGPSAEPCGLNVAASRSSCPSWRARWKGLQHSAFYSRVEAASGCVEGPPSVHERPWIVSCWRSGRPRREQVRLGQGAIGQPIQRGGDIGHMGVVVGLPELVVGLPSSLRSGLATSGGCAPTCHGTLRRAGAYDYMLPAHRELPARRSDGARRRGPPRVHGGCPIPKS